jgi:hypothetical protein
LKTQIISMIGEQYELKSKRKGKKKEEGIS